MLINHTDPLLHRSNTMVSDDELADNCKALQPILGLMYTTMSTYNALGISACQIGFDKTMFMMNINNQTKICINPEMIAANLKMGLAKEGCLSFHSLFLTVRRPIAVAVRYFDETGKQVTEQLDDLEARVFLHEFDHINGICFTDRVSKLQLDIGLRKQTKLTKGSNK